MNSLRMAALLAVAVQWDRAASGAAALLFIPAVPSVAGGEEQAAPRWEHPACDCEALGQTGARFVFVL